MLEGSFVLYVWRKSHLIRSFYLPTQNRCRTMLFDMLWLQGLSPSLPPHFWFHLYIIVATIFYCFFVRILQFQVLLSYILLQVIKLLDCSSMCISLASTKFRWFCSIFPSFESLLGTKYIFLLLSSLFWTIFEINPSFIHIP
jgi:hypothetical protein